MENRSYLIIDLKSFYASCECVMRGLDPMTTDLVVADAAVPELRRRNLQHLPRRFLQGGHLRLLRR